MKKIILLSAVLFSSLVFAEGAKTIQCDSGSDKRTLEIKVLDQGCEFIYTKQDKPSTLATQKVGFTKCDEVAEKIKGKLEASNFKCN